jgi:uncharacterized membrane protein YeiH
MFSSFLHLIDILGTFAFAVSGAFSAMERRLDLFGVLIISFVTAIGGGTIRDLLVGNLPVNWLKNNDVIIVILVSSLAAVVFSSVLRQWNALLFSFDALGLGLFTIVGIELGLRYQFSAGISIALGTISACFGGVLRDVLLNKVPLIFQKEIYALACIGGGLFYFALIHIGMPVDLVRVTCIFFIFLIRIIAVRFGLALPRLYVKKDA